MKDRNQLNFNLFRLNKNFFFNFIFLLDCRKMFSIENYITILTTRGEEFFSHESVKSVLDPQSGLSSWKKNFLSSSANFFFSPVFHIVNTDLQLKRINIVAIKL